MLVRAKRLGWNQRGGAIGQHDDYEPPAWVDDGLPDTIEGELSVQELPADEIYKARTFHTINGQLVDPETIEPV